MEQPKILKGGKHTDARGTLAYFNGFDMSAIRRFYLIEHPDTEIERGWRGHKIEQRWFSVCQGSFLIKLVKIDNWTSPNSNAEQIVFILDDTDVLYIPKGYASYLKANEPKSKLIIFADSKIEDAGLDDFLFPIDYFK